MVTIAPVEDPSEGRPGIATTTAQAKATKAPFLCLSSLKLAQLPEGLDTLKNLTNLDVSNNSITSIPDTGLPPSLVELTITGCQMTELPAIIGTLPRLKKLFAGANKLQRIEPVFQSQSLQHVGLAYNRVSELPPDQLLAGSPLLSLDLSHNDLEGLATTLDQLASLPSLAALSLGGTPLALAPRYVAEVRGRLKQLLYLDGQRLDLPSNSRPGTANSVGGRHLQQQQSATAGLGAAVAAAAASGSISSNRLMGPAGGRSFGGGPGGGGGGGASTSHPGTVRFEEGAAVGGGGGEVTAVTLTLRGLRPAEDPFGWLKKRWEEQIAVAEELGMTTPPTLEVPVPPLQPLIYHIEMTDVEGTPLACVPMRLAPPTPPDVAVMFDPKAKAAAAAAAAKEAKKAAKPTTPSKGKKGKGGPAAPAEAAAQRQLETGLLRVTLPLRAVAGHRNWLRSGTKVTMYKTTLTAVPRPPTAPDAATESASARGKAGGGGGRKKKDEPAPVEYDITSSTEAVGSAVLRAGAAVVDGYTTEASERLDFVPAPPLFDEKGVRTALRDPRHVREPVGHVDVVVRLHVPLPGAAGAWEG